jgi:hypothetical protein
VCKVCPSDKSKRQDSARLSACLLLNESSGSICAHALVINAMPIRPSDRTAPLVSLIYRQLNYRRREIASQCLVTSACVNLNERLDLCMRVSRFFCSPHLSFVFVINKGVLILPADYSHRIPLRAAVALVKI